MDLLDRWIKNKQEIKVKRKDKKYNQSTVSLSRQLKRKPLSIYFKKMLNIR